MTEQQMPARIWTGSEVPIDWGHWGVWSIEKDQEDISYVRSDIAERMAEALEELIDLEEPAALFSERIKRAKAALSAFRSATQDTEAGHD